MAGGNTKGPERTEDERQASEAHWARKRRSDLAHAIGFVIPVPPSNLNDDEEWEYGLSNSYTVWPEDGFTAFQEEMLGIARTSLDAVAHKGPIKPSDADSIEIYEYSSGPAAQEWPQYIVNFYLTVQPWADAADTWLALGILAKEALKRFSVWERTKAAVAKGRSRPLVDPYTQQETHTPTSVPIELSPSMTRDTLIALCYEHMHGFYQPVMPVKIDALSRGNTYSNPDHPWVGGQYLIVFRTGSRRFAYLVKPDGSCLEHYMESDDAIVLMPRPDLNGRDTTTMTDIFPTYSTVAT